jgi:PBP1b-binding outer membrane lipoprotein LpoB
MLLELVVGDIKGEKMMKKYFYGVVIGLALFINGCAGPSGTLAPLDNDNKAKEFKVNKEKANLYIYRNETFGFALLMPISINGKSIGKTAAKTYFHLNLKPGQYDITSEMENISKISLNLEPNKSYYVWQEVKMGTWMAQTLLQEVNASVGKEGVLESKMLATTGSIDEILPMGEVANSLNRNVANELRELHKLRSDNILTEEEFQTKKQELLKKL